MRRPRTHLLGLIAASLALGLFAATPGGASSTPDLGATQDEADLSAVEGTAPHGGGHAIPLEATSPDWLTDDLLAQVDSAGGPVEAPPDAPVASEVGIRPGSWMIAPSGCTMNFIFTDGADYAIGTAGHCVDAGGGAKGGGNGNGNGPPDDKGQGNDNGNGKGNGNGEAQTSQASADPIVLLTVAPGGDNPVLIEIGPVIAHRDNGIGDDFALIAIPDQYRDWVFPTVAQVLGPCGSYTGDGPETVAHHGHGLVIGTGGTSRAGVALTWKDDAYGWDGAAIFGDSGSPVRVTDLQAAGNLTHLVVSPNWLPSFIAGTRITKMLQIAGGSWQLVDSPYCLL